MFLFTNIEKLPYQDEMLEPQMGYILQNIAVTKKITALAINIPSVKVEMVHDRFTCVTHHISLYVHIFL